MKVLALILVFALAVFAEESAKEEKKVDKRGLLGLGYGYGHTEYGHSIVHPPTASFKVPHGYGYGHALYGYGYGHGLGYDYAPVYKTVHYSPSYTYGGYGHGYYGHGYGHHGYY